MARPSIGERGRRFVLEVPLEASDGFGGIRRTYQPGPQLWGAITLLSEGERLRADRSESALTHRVMLPFRAGVTAAMRLTCGSRRFRIAAVSDPDGRRDHLVCLVQELDP